ncbi:MAG: ATP-dependent helicase HrpB, partial [Bradymonadia bacterium]|jgi:ATP-dependent helicase HrpB
MSAPQLPIERIRPQVMAAFAQDDRVIVGAATGSGKSTRLPEWLLDAVDGQVLVVEPRRVACRSLASYLASQRGESVGQTVGSWVRFDKAVGKATRLIFATPGIALRLVAGGEQFGAIVLDEFHERGWQTDLLLARLRQSEQPYIITSATLDGDRIADELSCQYLVGEGRTFSLTIHHDEHPSQPSLRDVGRRVAVRVRQALEADSHSDVLVFLPGKREIREVGDAVRQLGEVVEVHGGVRPDILAKALSRGPSGRIFVATNVAETSLTIPGVGTVIDAGMLRRKLHRRGRSVLALDICSQAAMDQRAGRAGRVKEGVVYRLWAQRYRAQPDLPPEVARIELDEVVLAAASLGLPVGQATSIPWLDTPPEFAWDAALSRLRGLGALDGSGALTSSGSAWSRLPVGAEEAKLLATSSRSERATLCDLVALTEQRRRLMRPIDQMPDAAQAEIRAARAELLSQDSDEVCAELTLLRRGDLRAHYLDGAVMRDARRVADQLRAAVDADNKAPRLSASELATCLVRGWPERVYVVRPRALKSRKKQGDSFQEPWANGGEEVQVRLPVINWRPGIKPPQAGVVLDYAWIGDEGTGARAVGGFVLPVPLSAIGEAGLGESEVKNARVSRGGRVVGVVETTFAGVSLGENERPLLGRELREAAARLCEDNRLWKGAWSALLDALHLWRVAAHEAGKGKAPAEPGVWLRERLEELGVQDPEDTTLIGADDLLPDVEADTGMAAWDLERLLGEMPRTWEYLGAQYSCDVNPVAARVTLRPANKAARGAKEPPRSVLPSYRGFRIFYEKASRVVQLR